MIHAALTIGVDRKLRIVGEISNFSDRSHWFFSIKDAQATLRCVCFASVARRIKVDITDGMQVVVTGRVDFYDAQGHVQIYVDKIEPVGQGALELRFQQLCQELRGLGYFELETKRSFPLVPRRIAVITSRSAAALQDVIDTTHRRWRGCQLLLMDVRVQGEQAASEIAAAIDAVSEHGSQLEIDAILLTRGGGSMEDLWAFNERVVADAIHRCLLPIVAAIGHETDTTIAELVADARCATPTQAAMTLVPDRSALLMQIRQYGQRLGWLLGRQLQNARQRLDYAAGHPIFRRPETMTESAESRVHRLSVSLNLALSRRVALARGQVESAERVLVGLEPRGRLRQAFGHTENLGQRLRRGILQMLRSHQAGVNAMARQLAAVGPRSVLARGYSYTHLPNGQLLRSAHQAKRGQRITTVLIDGRIHSRVEGQTAPTPKVTAEPVEQLDLFSTPPRQPPVT